MAQKDKGMSRLGEWLNAERKRAGGYDALAETTGLGRGTLERIIKGQQDMRRAKLSTLHALTKLGVSLEQVQEMAGITTPGDEELEGVLHRLQARAEADPQLAEILRLLQQTDQADRRAILAYLRGAGAADPPTNDQ